jgi:hypothetical protein
MGSQDPRGEHLWVPSAMIAGPKGVNYRECFPNFTSRALPACGMQWIYPWGQMLLVEASGRGFLRLPGGTHPQ